MELNYNFKVKNSTVKSALLGADTPEKSDIYIDKKQGWLRYDVEFNKDSTSINTSKVFEIKHLNNKTIFKTNTLSVLITNIIMDSTPYYYKINVERSKEVSLSYLIVDLNLKDVVEYSGNFYTNTKTYLYNSENDFIFTEKVIDLEDCVVIFRSDFMEIEAPKNSYIHTSKLVIEPEVINQYSFYLPSFYLKDKESNKNIQVIESDIKIFDSKLNIKSNEHLKYKLEKKTFNVLKDFNISFSILESKDVTYRVSTHCLIAENITNYFTVLSDGSIIEGDRENYTFKIIKNINLDNIEITPNNYKYLEDKYKDIRGIYINTYLDLNKDLNAFGITYNQISDLVFKYNYISNINYTPFGFKRNINLATKSLKTDASKVKVLPPLDINSINYTELDSVNYLTNKNG